jgi:glycosyltransferase involved in cell wall biosynthesis
MSKLSIIIPAYNEESTIHLILDRVRKVELLGGVEKEVIIVNDCSADNTEKAIAKYKLENPEFPLTCVVHEINKGKGAAIHTGIKEASGDFLIIQDADLEYDPEEYNLLLKPMLLGSADVVYGSRFIGGEPHRILFFWHTIGNKLLTFLSNMFSNLNLSDMETCYKLFRSEIIKGIPLFENRFGFEPEVTQKIARIEGIRIYEVGISYYGRTYLEGKKINWQDGFRALYCIAKYSVVHKKKIKSDKTDSSIKISRKKDFLIIAILAALFFTTGIHNSSKHYRYAGFHYIFQSDGLGYYQYLPAVFLKHDIVGGQPWYISLSNGKNLNKYTMGVAYMQSPFFFMANILRHFSKQADDGYSNTYGFFILVGAMIYCFLALSLIFKMLLPRFGLVVAFIVPVLLFYGTNLIYYTLGEAAMSHVYMFFLYALIVYRTPLFYKKQSFKNTIWIAVPLAIVTLIRQYNIVVILYLLLYDVKSWKSLVERTQFWLSKWYFGILFLITIFIVFIPQMVYWHLVTGKWFIYAYGYAPAGPEKFLYLAKPKVIEVLFGSISGIYTYAPVLLFNLVGIVIMIIKRSRDVWPILIIQLITLYLISSWWCYTFDCGYGHRGFIDYYALFAIPMAYSLHKIISYRKTGVKTLLAFTFVFLMYLNVRLSLMYNWDPCWSGSSWKWKQYSNVINKAVKGGDYRQNYHVIE